MGTGLSIGTSMFASQPWMASTNIGMFSPMSMGTSIYSSGTSSSGSGSSYASSTETAEQREKRIKRELDKKNQAIASQNRKAQQELISQMQQNPDMFSALTDEEEQILLNYMQKMDNAENNKGAFNGGNMMQLGSTAMTCAYALQMAGTVASYGGSAAKWCSDKVGLTKVGNAIADSKAGKWVSKTATSVKNSGFVQGTKNIVTTINNAPTNVINKAAEGATMGTKATNFVAGSAKFTGTVAKYGAVSAAVITVMEDVDELSIAYKDGFGSGVKQTGQTAVKAGAAAGGFWAGAKGGAFLGAKIGACCGPIGAAIGGVVGGLLGGLVGFWGAKKVAKAVVGKDVGDKIREQQAVEATKVGQGQELTESQTIALSSVAQFAQQDSEIDEKTLAVLQKIGLVQAAA